MIKDGLNRRRFVWLCLVLGLLMACPLLAAEHQPRQRRERPQHENTQRRDTDRTTKRALPAEAAEAFRAIQSTLKDILTSVSQNQRPEEALLETAGQLLTENKRYVQICDTDHKVDFMLTQAWVSYYQDDLDTAMNWALRAAKTDETVQDAWISSSIFCMLNDKKPILPRVKKTPPRRSNNRRAGDDMDRGMPDEPKMQKGVLAFDVLSLRQEMFSEHFEQIDYQQQWGEQLDYQAGSDTLCLLFWQSEIDPKTVDANDIDHQGAPRNTMPDEFDMMMEMAPQARPPVKGRLQAQRNYFKQMSRLCKEHPSLKFMQINTDLPEQVKIIGIEEMDDEKMSKEIAAGTYVPLIFAAENLEPKQYAGLTAAGPFMLVLNPEGKLRYAGPAADFVPAFILTAVTGVEIDLDKMVQTKSAGPARKQMNDLLYDDMMMMEMMSPPKRAKKQTVVDPNKPVADPNKPSVQAIPSKAKAAKAPATEPMTDEQRYEAERLLSEGQLHIDGSRKIRGKSPEKGIIACREILNKYPGTEYAVKAQELLRRVPDRYKSKYKITSDELGY